MKITGARKVSSRSIHRIRAPTNHPPTCMAGKDPVTGTFVAIIPGRASRHRSRCDGLTPVTACVPGSPRRDRRSHWAMSGSSSNDHDLGRDISPASSRPASSTKGGRNLHAMPGIRGSVRFSFSPNPSRPRQQKSLAGAAGVISARRASAGRSFFPLFRGARSLPAISRSPLKTRNRASRGLVVSAPTGGGR